MKQNMQICYHLTQYSGTVLLQMTGLCFGQIAHHVYVCVCMYMCICVCVCMYVYMYISHFLLLSWGWRLSVGLGRACSTSGLYTQSSFYFFFGGDRWSGISEVLPRLALNSLCKPDRPWTWGHPASILLVAEIAAVPQAWLPYFLISFLLVSTWAAFTS